jgi:hypothetical protein
MRGEGRQFVMGRFPIVSLERFALVRSAGRAVPRSGELTDVLFDAVEVLGYEGDLKVGGGVGGAGRGGVRARRGHGLRLHFYYFIAIE